MKDDIETLRRFIGFWPASEKQNEAIDALDRVENDIANIIGNCEHALHQADALRAKLNRAKEALERLGGMEAFTVSRAVDKLRDEELLARIDFARAVLSELSAEQTPLAPTQQTPRAEDYPLTLEATREGPWGKIGATVRGRLRFNKERDRHFYDVVLPNGEIEKGLARYKFKTVDAPVQQTQTSPKKGTPK